MSKIRKNRRLALLVMTLSIVMILTMPSSVQAAHDPPGTRANSGHKIPGTFSAFYRPVPKPSVFNYAYVQDYWGDAHVRGYCTQTPAQVLTYYCVIKISPEDSSHNNLQIKIDLDLSYSFWAAYGGRAEWKLDYGVYDMSQANIIPQTGHILSSWSDSYIGPLFWGGSDTYCTFDSNDGYYTFYDRPAYMIYPGQEHLYVAEFLPSEWYYVGFTVTFSLNGYSRIYRYNNYDTAAFLNPLEICWQFY